MKERVALTTLPHGVDVPDSLDTDQTSNGLLLGLAYQLLGLVQCSLGCYRDAAAAAPTSLVSTIVRVVIEIEARESPSVQAGSRTIGR